MTDNTCSIGRGQQEWLGKRSQMVFPTEVFADRVEVFRFFDQRTDICYEEHRPGQPFSSRFLAELTALPTEQGGDFG